MSSHVEWRLGNNLPQTHSAIYKTIPMDMSERFQPVDADQLRSYYTWQNRGKDTLDRVLQGKPAEYRYGRIAVFVDRLIRAHTHSTE